MAARPASGKRPAALGVALDRAWTGACAAAFLALCVLLHRFVTDDAWITVRYAENLASGAGFVFNPGGPRVEGFSNPLLVSAEALGHALDLPALGVARALGIGAGLALIALLHVAAPPVVGRRATRAALALTAAYPPLALWAVGGLETLPAALATTAGVLALCRQPVTRRHAALAGAAFAVLPWLRPEGLAIALAVALAAGAYPVLRGPDRRAALVRLGLAAGLPLLSQAALEAVRLAIYGHALPNSVIYKSGEGGAFDILAKFALQATPALAAGVAGMLLARGRQRLLAVPPLVYVVGSIGTMDSANAFGRFLLPTWPLWALLAGLAVAAAYRRRPALGAVAATVLVLAGLATLPAALRYTAYYADCRQAARAGAAEWLRTGTPAGTVYSVSDAGLVPARAGRTAVDHFLLNEALLQRTGPLPVSGQVEHAFRRDPDVMVLASRDPSRFAGRYVVDGVISRDPRLARYEPAHVARGGGPGCDYHLWAFRRSGSTDDGG
jgi:arabinofuranosyltransferase